MVCVGIDVAKDKHDCCILDSEGTTLVDCFTIPNNMDGFKSLLQTIQDCSQKSDKIKVGLEATGHYSYNILGFLLDNDLPVYVMNPLHTNLYRKSLSLRKTKTDRVSHLTDQKRSGKTFFYNATSNGHLCHVQMVSCTVTCRQFPNLTFAPRKTCLTTATSRFTAIMSQQ